MKSCSGNGYLKIYYNVFAPFIKFPHDKVKFFLDVSDTQSVIGSCSDASPHLDDSQSSFEYFANYFRAALYFYFRLCRYVWVINLHISLPQQTSLSMDLAILRDPICIWFM